MLGDLADDVTQMVDLLLPGNVALGAARVLNVLLPAHDLPQRVRLGTLRVPHVRGKDHRVLARLVIEHGLDRRVRIDASVPIGLAVDADGRKRRR